MKFLLYASSIFKSRLNGTIGKAFTLEQSWSQLSDVFNMPDSSQYNNICQIPPSEQIKLKNLSCMLESKPFFGRSTWTIADSTVSDTLRVLS